MTMKLDASLGTFGAQERAQSAIGAMNIIILDDYQDAVRKLRCGSKLETFNAKVFTLSLIHI